MRSWTRCLGNWSLIFLFLLCGLNVHAQKYFFEQLTTAEGLPSDYVNCMFQDSKGNLWIGTDKGACCYDGNHFIYFNKDNGLTSNFVYCIAEDPRHNIWMGTFEGGLCVYDGKTVRHLPLDEDFKTIRRLLINPDGSFFITNYGLILYFFSNENARPQKLVNGPLNSIVPQGKNHWLSNSGEGVYSISRIKDSLVISELYKRESEKTEMPASLSGNRFIVVSGNKALVYEVNGNNPEIKKQVFLKKQLPVNYEKNIYSRANELWIGSNGLQYANEDGQVQVFGAESGLGANLIQNFYNDNHGNLYMCTYGAGIRLWSDLAVKQLDVDGKINCIYPFDSSVYITTTKSVYKYMPGKLLAEYKNLGFENFISLSTTVSGKFYVGSYSSFLCLPGERILNTLNTSSKKKYEHKMPPGVSGFVFRNDGTGLIATYGDGIYLYDKYGRKKDTLTTSNSNLGSQLIEFLMPLKHKVAALTYGSGLTFIDEQNKSTSLTQQQGLLSNTVYSVYQEQENEIWIGTESGLNLCESGQIVKTFAYAQGFIGSRALCIFRDADNRFWVLSDKYLHLFEHNHLRAIRSCHLLPDQKNAFNRAAYDSKTNTLYIGLTNSLLVVDMKKVVPDTSIQFPLLQVAYSNNNLLPIAGGRASMIGGRRYLNFKINSSYTSLRGRPDLYVWLKGFDEDWKRLENNNQVIYQNLPSGKYRLLGKSINPDGYISPEVELLQLDIKPFFWNQFWFRLFTGLLLLGIFFYIGKQIAKKRYERRIAWMQQEHRIQLDRERIARELHDNVGSQLTYLINKIEDDHIFLADKEQAGRLSGFARVAMRELRETIWALDKKEILPEELENKVRQLVQLYEDDKHIIVMNWQNENGDQKPFKSLEALNIYRIVQEAMTNAFKYSNASQIKVHAFFEKHKLRLSITDNGIGFDMEQVEKGYGFRNMNKRAEEMNALLRVQSSPGRGTLVSLKFRDEKENQPFS